MRKYTDLIIGIMLIAYNFYIKIKYGNLNFNEFFLFMGFILVIYHYAKSKIKIYDKTKKLFKKIMFIGLITFIVCESLIIIYPKNNTKDNCDYLIILGASVKNTTPSLTLKLRLDSAISYLNKTKDKCYIVVSGGKGDKENISEALAMKNYLVNYGIKTDRIIMEDKSTNTYENFKYSKDKIEKHSKNNIENLYIKVVTTDFHSLRSYILAKRNKYKNVSFFTSKSKMDFVPIFYTREFFALWKSIILDT